MATHRYPSLTLVFFLPATNRQPNVLRSMYQTWPVKSEQGCNLLAAMLEYDPLKRITAEDALNHPYFQEDPRPGLECVVSLLALHTAYPHAYFASNRSMAQPFCFSTYQLVVSLASLSTFPLAGSRMRTRTCVWQGHHRKHILYHQLKTTAAQNGQEWSREYFFSYNKRQCSNKAAFWWIGYVY